MSLRFFFVFLFLAAIVDSRAQLQITELTKNAFVYTTYRDYDGNPFPSNSMYVVTDSGVVLIDTPWDSTQFEALLDHIEQQHQKPVVLCIATHFHDDRTAGLDYYASKGIETWSSQATYQLCQRYGERRAEYIFQADTVFHLGQYTFETFYPGPGHSPDNIVIWVPELKILYGGCFLKSVENTGLGNLEHANPVAWKQSLRHLQAQKWNYKYVIPGHFTWDDKRAVKHTLKLVKKYCKASRIIP